jgi:hypothetical protein
VELRIKIDDKDFEELKAEFMAKIIKSLIDLNHGNNNIQAYSEWVDDIEAKKILGYRSKTKMQELRNSGAIVFSRYGRKIKYLRQSLMDFLEKNKKINTYNYGS